MRPLCLREWVPSSIQNCWPQTLTCRRSQSIAVLLKLNPMHAASCYLSSESELAAAPAYGHRFSQPTCRAPSSHPDTVCSICLHNGWQALTLCMRCNCSPLAVLETFAACLLLPVQGHKSLPWALILVLGLEAVASRHWVAHLPLLGREGPHTGLQALLEEEVRHMAPLSTPWNIPISAPHVGCDKRWIA